MIRVAGRRDRRNRAEEQITARERDQCDRRNEVGERLCAPQATDQEVLGAERNEGLRRLETRAKRGLPVGEVEPGENGERAPSRRCPRRRPRARLRERASPAAAAAPRSRIAFARSLRASAYLQSPPLRSSPGRTPYKKSHRWRRDRLAGRRVLTGRSARKALPRPDTFEPKPGRQRLHRFRRSRALRARPAPYAVLGSATARSTTPTDLATHCSSPAGCRGDEGLTEERSERRGAAGDRDAGQWSVDREIRRAAAARKRDTGGAGVARRDLQVGRLVGRVDDAPPEARNCPVGIRGRPGRSLKVDPPLSVMVWKRFVRSPA